MLRQFHPSNLTSVSNRNRTSGVPQEVSRHCGPGLVMPWLAMSREFLARGHHYSGLQLKLAVGQTSKIQALQYHSASQGSQISPFPTAPPPKKRSPKRTKANIGQTRRTKHRREAHILIITGGGAVSGRSENGERQCILVRLTIKLWFAGRDWSNTIAT